jgi:rSAM/selenodomain-associated transferase 1
MVDLQGTDVVAILTRAPSAGGKTRLFRELGCAPDPHLLASLLLDTLDAIDAIGCTRVACFTPPSDAAEMRALVPPDVLLLPQRDGDLGDRMRLAFDELLARGAGSVVLIGSDVPGIEPSAVLAATCALRERPTAVVLGPARDGGYYLIAASRTPNALFDRMEWGQPDVLVETEHRARLAGIEIVRVAAGSDVDTLADLRTLIRSDAPARRTRVAFNSRVGSDG